MIIERSIMVSGIKVDHRINDYYNFITFDISEFSNATKPSKQSEDKYEFGYILISKLLLLGGYCGLYHII